MVRLSQVAEFKSCITCVYRKLYPAALRKEGPIFFAFHCERSVDSGKSVVRPEDVCDYWRGVTLGFEG